ncbi:MAG: ABC1 kinase family protein [Thermincolia bacterium]
MKDLIRLIFNQRFRKVVGLFFIFYLQFWWLNKLKRFYSEDKIEAKYKQIYRKQGQMFADRAIEYGGLLIKLGQFFSSRVDLLPEEYTQELSKLQDAVTPVRTDEIIKTIEAEFNRPINEVYSHFNNEPIAAASLGQVHEGVLPDGRRVAVKVLRPGIEEVIAIDLEAIRVVTIFGKRVERISNMADLDEVYFEFWDTVNDELDYIKEVKNAEEFRNNFIDDDRIYIPKIFDHLSTAKVITMEFIEGIKINEYQLLADQGYNKGELAEILLSSYLRQFLADGFFHADPHPGNIFVNKEGKIVFLDFGMVGRVNSQMKDSMIDLIMGVVKRDPGAVVEAFGTLGFLRPHADRGTMMKSITFMLDQFYGDVKAIDFNEFSHELREFLYSQPFQVPARTVFLGKALNTLTGLCFGLDPNFNLVKVASPYINEMFGGEEKGGTVNVLINQVKSTFFDLIAVPNKINRLVDGLESGDLKVHINKGFEQRVLEQQAMLNQRVVNSILASGLLIAGAQLLEGSYHQLGLVFMVVGGLVLGLQVIQRPGSRSRRRGMNSIGSGFKRPKLHP